MKYLLAAMCGVAAIFMGGCTVLGLAAGPFALLPAAITFLNLAIIGALFGWKLQWRPAFYILAAIDAVIAVGCAGMAIDSPSSDEIMFFSLAAIFAVKGVLSLIYGIYPEPLEQ